ncbi:MAG: hypothetical protein JXB07_14190 [Anaerolineae bacterium]|nr:hypothetical protein [Anaerolineae bacterium]
MSQLQYPLQMSFKIMAFAPQIFVRDNSGRDLFYVHQKLFKLKEDIGVFRDSSKSQEMFRIKADRVIDFSARYNFTDSNSGATLGSIKREGMRSIFKASYNIFGEGEQITHHIKEDNAMVKVIDAIFGEIPVLGIFSGYFFNPSYTVYQSGTETPILRIHKRPSFLEGKFEIEKLAEPLNEAEEVRLLLSIMMMTLLERSRG